MRRVRRYSFDSSIKKELSCCFKLDNYHGLLQLLEDWFIIIVSIIFSRWVWQHQSIGLGLVAYCINIFVIGARMRALADLLHQATHETLAKNKTLNFLLGTFPSGYLILQSYSGYRQSHVLCHHGRFGDSQQDPDYVGLQENGLYGKNLSNQTVRRYLWNIFYPSTTLTYLRYLLKNRILHPQEQFREKLSRLTYLLLLQAVLTGLGWGEILLLYWWIPLITTANWLGAFIELFEHYPLMELTIPDTEEELNRPELQDIQTRSIDISMSRNRLCSLAENFWVGTHWEGYHLVHHLFPGIPSWRFKQAHHILMQDPVYAARNQTYGWWSIYHEILMSS